MVTPPSPHLTDAFLFPRTRDIEPQLYPIRGDGRGKVNLDGCPVRAHLGGRGRLHRFRFSVRKTWDTNEPLAKVMVKSGINDIGAVPSPWRGEGKGGGGKISLYYPIVINGFAPLSLSPPVGRGNRSRDRFC